MYQTDKVVVKTRPPRLCMPRSNWRFIFKHSLHAPPPLLLEIDRHLHFLTIFLFFPSQTLQNSNKTNDWPGCGMYKGSGFILISSLQFMITWKPTLGPSWPEFQSNVYASQRSSLQFLGGLHKQKFSISNIIVLLLSYLHM